MDKDKIIEQIYELLFTVEEAYNAFKGNANTDELKRDIEDARACIEQTVLQEFGDNLPTQIESNELDTGDWIIEISHYLYVIKERLISFNIHDQAFYDYIKQFFLLSSTQISEKIRKTYCDAFVEMQDNVVSMNELCEDYFAKYPFWGKLNVAEGIYEAYDLRAQNIKRHLYSICWLYLKLDDYLSKKTLFAILLNWTEANINDISVVKSIFSDYYEPDIYRDNKNEIFVDLGAYTGDSIYSYIANYGVNYKKIYAYEITNEPIESLKQLASRYPNIDIRQKGVGKEKGVMYLNSNDTSNSANSLQNDGSDAVEIVALDEDIEGEVGFIKMDIEGAEQDALWGACEKIRIYKPRLAVCTYHGCEDLWKIPSIIDRIRDDYTFYFRHYGGNVVPTEFVLLCK